MADGRAPSREAGAGLGQTYTGQTHNAVEPQ